MPGSSQYTFGHKEDDKEEDKEMDTDPFEGSPSSHLSAHDLSLQSQSALPACTITDLAADVADLLPMCTLEDTATDASVQPRVLKSAWSNFTDANEGSAEPASAARRALAYRVPRARDPLDEWLGRSIGIDLSVDWLNVRASSSSSDETEGDDAQAVKSLGEYLGRSAAERGFILIGSPTDAGKGARSEMKNKSLSDEQPPESDSGAENMDVDQLTLQDTEGCEATPPTRLTLFVPTAQPSSCHADEQPASAAATNADHRPDLQSLSFDSKKAVPDANDRRDDQAQTQAQKQQQQQQRPTAPVRSASGLASPNSATRAAVLRALRQHRAAARPASSSRRISAATGAPTGAAGAFGEADADADGEGSFVELEFTLESSRTLSRQELVSLLTNAAIAPPAPVVAAAVGAGGKV